MGADVQLAEQSRGRRHRIRLERTRATDAGELHGGTHQLRSDAAAPVALADHEARDAPDAVVELVLVPPVPRHPVVAEHPRIRGPRLDRPAAFRNLLLGLTSSESRRQRLVDLLFVF